jgi:small-conductance mechanosensitive channel
VVAVVRRVLSGVYPESQRLVVDLVVAVVGVFLWFGAALALFKIVGLGDVAASLGTASGFVGLGVAFALKEMIADTVAGVYLLRDPDFNEGDVVESASVTGEIVSIDLRKTRLRAEDGDLVVVANRDVEKKWRQDSVGSESAESEQALGG